MDLGTGTCPNCGGKGYVETPPGLDGYLSTWRTVWCDPCAGHGTVTTDYSPDYELEMQ